MEQKLLLVKIDTNYCDFLRKFDKRVPYNKDKKELRPFVGVLFNIKNMLYFAPLSSPKPKHLKMHNTLDFYKIDRGTLGAINFNNMLPVLEGNYTLIDLNAKNVSKKDKNYQELLKSQFIWLNEYKQEVLNRSFKLYSKYINNTLRENIKRRCCNFKLLEEKCQEYKSVAV